ncbi:MAG: hypothetical protein L3K17_07500 [Thermoplasmata archaeon]|nr:hypothetical protein [Thermoplasmata archaeon]
MRLRAWLRGLTAFTTISTLLALTGLASAGQSDLQMTMPLVWVLLALSLGGAGLTFGVLAWTLWKYRDPAVRGRRYG